MPYELNGRNVLITGGSRGLGATIATTFAAQGANIAINYQSNSDAATFVTNQIRERHPRVKAVALQADVGSMAECEALVERARSELGGLDVVVANAGYTKFSQFGDLNALSEDDWDKCWAVNVKGKVALLRAALPTFNANAEGGVFLITGSVAAVQQSGSSMAYSVTKAAQLHLMKCLAATQGDKVRVNAVLPGLLLTEWGEKYPPETIEAMKEKAALKSVTDLQDCADAYVMLVKNTSITGAKIQVDAGLFVNSA
ncbi:short chain dehydrogenase/reductase [Phyllosticta citriasiana]|uniref:Short chain dehydrogenase/reductase n=1 Tax=Phyllosticta citriasiana TaxID=595635 RepID=A0ABR1KX59_9PEZI